MRSLLITLVSLFFVVIAGPLAAQEDTDTGSRLLSTLALVPDTPAAYGEIYFYDRLAVTLAYPPAALPADYEQFDNVVNGEGNLLTMGTSLWWRIYFNNVTDVLAESVMDGGSYAEELGADFFDITATLQFGTPPEQGLILLGDFRRPSVGAALMDQGFVREESDLFCSPDGCDEGLRTSLMDIYRGNPFGGRIGRKQPIVVSREVMMSSPVLELVEGHRNAVEGAPSLAQNPDYAAAADIADAAGPVIQAYVLGGESLASIQSPPTETNDELVPLPVYDLLMFASTATEDEEVLMMLFVYADEAAAATAATQIDGILNGQRDIALVDDLTDFGFAAPVVEAVNTEERSVVVVRFSREKLPVSTILGGGESGGPDRFTTPEFGMRVLTRAIFTFDLPWLLAE